MSFFSNLFSAGPTGSGSNLMSFLPMVVIFALFWLLLIRPQQKKMKQHNAMLATLEKGSKVLTNAGIVGKIMQINDKFIDLEVAPGVVMTFQRSTIAGKLEANDTVTSSK